MSQCGVPAAPAERVKRRPPGRPPRKRDQLLALIEASGGGLTVAELAALAGMSTSAAQQFLFRYERAGLLVKRPATWRMRRDQEAPL